MFIFGIIFIENGPCFIWLFEFGFSASEFQLQQHAAGDYSIHTFLLAFLVSYFVPCVFAVFFTLVEIVCAFISWFRYLVHPWWLISMVAVVV